MKNIISVISVIILFSVLSCGAAGTTTVTTKQGAADKKIILEIVPGAEWEHTIIGVKGAGISTTPQFVVWAEDPNTGVFDTLYVTGKYASQSWFSATERPSTIPYWGFKMAGKDAKKPFAPPKDKPLDTITSASPQAGFVLNSVVPDTQNGIMIFVEINSSLDFNEFYKNNLPSNDVYFSGKDGDGGQPALVYHALVLPIDGTNWVPLVVAGHSSPSGADGGLYTNLAGLTTTLDIVKSIRVRYAE